MPYRVLMEVLARPDNIPDWVWNETNANTISSTGGKAWTGKLNADDDIHEYDDESDATTKMDELFDADSTTRRYKVVEV
jgi:hypothetical protein|tara:strand:+ start:825 stop:1061 length:237 start_codon:yes stop_codon:yes gene_type:complete